MKKHHQRILALSGFLFLTGWTLNGMILQGQDTEEFDQKVCCTVGPEKDSLNFDPLDQEKPKVFRSPCSDSNHLDLNLPKKKPIISPQAPIKHRPGKVPALPGMGLYPMDIGSA